MLCLSGFELTRLYGQIFWPIGDHINRVSLYYVSHTIALVSYKAIKHTSTVFYFTSRLKFPLDPALAMEFLKVESLKRTKNT